MFYVYEHRYGSVMIQRGPMEGCDGFPEHKWLRVSAHRKKAEAIAAADAHPCHAQVYRGLYGEAVHDNKKAAGKR